jgi:hypothetical protein
VASSYGEANAIAEPAARPKQTGEKTRRSSCRNRAEVLPGDTRSVLPTNPSNARPPSAAVKPTRPSLRGIDGNGGMLATNDAPHSSATATETQAPAEGTSTPPITASARLLWSENGNDEPFAHRRCAAAMPASVAAVDRVMKRVTRPTLGRTQPMCRSVHQHLRRERYENPGLSRVALGWDLPRQVRTEPALGARRCAVRCAWLLTRTNVTLTTDGSRHPPSEWWHERRAAG